MICRMKKNTEAYRFLEIIQQHELLRLEGDWDESFQDEKFMEGNTWKKYLEGYETVRALSREEKETIPAFAALRELWMIGLHAEVMEKNAGCCWYQDDYFDYQLKVFRQWLNRCGLLSE